ncbi:MAG: hypothetical protein KME33_11150 [Aetokthonos hydrillicola CCALA 1050]|jgi:hypothetical protein|nr:hypothetical protein [Aetokthonos hydrillicola CCALA 1050]
MGHGAWGMGHRAWGMGFEAFLTNRAKWNLNVEKLTLNISAIPVLKFWSTMVGDGFIIARCVFRQFSYQ